jgi:hypothetical protein
MEGKKWVITDPVTGYMISALTRHYSPRKKFHRHWGGYVEMNYDDYSSHPFDRHKGKLFVINKRNGGESTTGRRARHWSEDILQLEKFYYSPKLENYISENPERFELLWEQDKIMVYRLH